MPGFGVEHQWCRGDHAAKADVGDVAHTVQSDQAQTVSASGPRAFGLPHHNPSGDATGVEAQLLKQSQEYMVELITVATATVEQDFLFNGRQVYPHRFARQCGEVFKREGTGVAQLQLAQGFQGG